MPRAKLPEYFKGYSVTINTEAETPAMALRWHKESIDYHKRWIKGTLVSEENFGEGKYLTTTLTYSKGGSDGQVGQEDEHGEEESQTELPS